MTQSIVEIPKKSQRTLPGVLTAVGPIFVGTAKAAVVPLSIEFMFVRELAWRVLDPDYPVRTSLGSYVEADETQEVC